MAWAHEHLGEKALAAIAIFSVVAFLLGVVVTPLIVIRLSPDYFVRRESTPPAALTAGRVLLLVARNLLGGVLILLGTLMLVLPGQGLVTLLVGLLVLDFRGKRQWERKLIARPGVLRVVNGLRSRAGRAPLEIPHPD
jgi:hypothetical protein